MSSYDLREMYRSFQELEEYLEDVELKFEDLIKDFAFDIQIVCAGIILPSHKYVLNSRSKVLSGILCSGDVNNLDWNAYESRIAIALLRWFYTDKIVPDDDDTVTLGLLQAAHNFGLSSLFETCERKLLDSVNENFSSDFFEIAKEVDAKLLIEKYLKIQKTSTITLNERSEIEIDQGVKSNSLAMAYFSYEDLDHVGMFSQEEMRALLKRQENLNENRIKLKKRLTGVREYVNFFDAQIWGWPAHQFVLSGRSKKLQRGDLTNAWSGLTKQNERDLMRWVYTDAIRFERIGKTLALLQTSHKYELHALYERCEEAVIQGLCLTTSAHVHIIATRLNATNIVDRCERTIDAYWSGIQPELLKDAIDPNRCPADLKVTICETIPENAEAGSLLTLNDDCLLYLFRFISLVDLGSIKDTCKRLHRLADQSFKLYRDKSLKISRYSMVADIWNLKHFGKFLKSLSLDSLYEKYCSRTEILPIIARFSNERLNRISLSLDYDEDVTEKSLMCLENVLKNVKIIELNDCDGKLVELLLSFCESLSEIHIDCEELELNTLWCENNSNVKSVTLRELHNDDVLEEICDELKHLESVTLNIPDNNDKLNNLTKLNRLKHLTIEVNDAETLSVVVTPLLENLAVKNVLEYLCIQSAYMTEIAASAICNFSKLKHLQFEYTDLNDNVLNILSEKLNVNWLTFRDCEEITFEDITKIVVNKLNLSVLTVSGCDNVEVIERQNYLRLRKKRNLQIFLDADTFEKTIKLLKKDLSDYVKIAAIATD